MSLHIPLANKMFIPNKRTRLSMLVALRPLLGLGSAAPALQLPSLGSKISVESKLLSDPSKPPLTRRICNDRVLNKYRFYKSYLSKTYLTHSLFYRHIACAGVVVSPGVETWEILLPSMDTVHGHCSEGVATTGDHHCVSVRVRDGTGFTVINNVTNLIILTINLTAFRTYYVEFLSGKPGSWVPSGVIRVVVCEL